MAVAPGSGSGRPAKLDTAPAIAAASASSTVIRASRTTPVVASNSASARERAASARAVPTITVLWPTSAGRPMPNEPLVSSIGAGGTAATGGVVVPNTPRFSARAAADAAAGAMQVSMSTSWASNHARPSRRSAWPRSTPMGRPMASSPAAMHCTSSRPARSRRMGNDGAGTTSMPPALQRVSASIAAARAPAGATGSMNRMFRSATSSSPCGNATRTTDGPVTATTRNGCSGRLAHPADAAHRRSAMGPATIRMLELLHLDACEDAAARHRAMREGRGAKQRSRRVADGSRAPSSKTPRRGAWRAGQRRDAIPAAATAAAPKTEVTSTPNSTAL
jgi:hypothetical protein